MLSSTEKENEFSSRVPNCSRLFRFFRSKVDWGSRNFVFGSGATPRRERGQKVKLETGIIDGLKATPTNLLESEFRHQRPPGEKSF